MKCNAVPASAVGIGSFFTFCLPLKTRSTLLRFYLLHHCVLLKRTIPCFCSVPRCALRAALASLRGTPSLGLQVAPCRSSAPGIAPLPGQALPVQLPGGSRAPSPGAPDLKRPRRAWSLICEFRPAGCCRWFTERWVM